MLQLKHRPKLINELIGSRVGRSSLRPLIIIVIIFFNFSKVRVIKDRVSYDGTDNFEFFRRTPIPTQIWVIYNYLGIGYSRFGILELHFSSFIAKKT